MPNPAGRYRAQLLMAAAADKVTELGLLPELSQPLADWLRYEAADAPHWTDDLLKLPDSAGQLAAARFAEAVLIATTAKRLPDGGSLAPKNVP